MKVTELKIGDWIDAKGSIVKIDELFFGACHPMSDEEREADRKHIQPVPLTEGILRKNGWTYGRSDKSWCSPDEELYVYPNNGRFDVYVGRRCPIQYVHELQHILWALKMEDTIEI